jgi:hypothetical protein
LHWIELADHFSLHSLVNLHVKNIINDDISQQSWLRVLRHQLQDVLNALDAMLISAELV